MPNFQAKYVVLTHDWPQLHWDFMLENEAALRTFRLSHPPDTPGFITATPLPDHRVAYLEYEGPVSGGRGNVERWDRGEYLLLEDGDERLEVQLRGERLRGTVVLSRAAGAEEWEFRYTPGAST